MKQLRQEIEKLVCINEQEWEQIESQFSLQTLPKGHLIHQAGEIFRKTYYIKNGSARAFLIDSQGKDFTWQLYFRDSTSSGGNHFLDDSVSYYEQQGSFLSFETLENSQFYVIDNSTLDDFFNSDKKFEKMARQYLHDNLFSPMYKRTLSIMSEDAQTRYNRLIKAHPNIFKHIKAYHIASYLGIAPQTLSKIRKMNLDE